MVYVLPVIFAGNQTYEAAPLTFNVAVSPWQITGLFTVNVGVGVTKIVITVFVEQLFLVVVKLNTVVVFGATEILLVFKPVGVQV